jgi:DNA-binding PadR family transcriptional regulator
MNDLERQYLRAAYELARNDAFSTFQNHEVADMLDLDTSVSDRVNQANGIAENLISRDFIEDARRSPTGVSRTDGALRLTKAGLEEAERLADPIEQRKELRRDFLRAVYEQANGSPARLVGWPDLAPRFGFADTRYPPSPIIDLAEQLEGSGLISIETEEATAFRITPEGVDEVEGNRPQPQQNVTTTFNMPNSTFIQSAVGNENTNTFSGDMDFSTVEQRIEEEGGADKEVLLELVAEMRELLESGQTLDKGRLARFNDKLKEYPWLAGPVAGWLLNFGTQEIGQYLN